MSSILEALRKLEEEKAARRGGAGNIAGRVTTQSRRSRQRPAWLAPAALAAVAAVAVLATYTIMGGFSQRHGETAPRESAAPAMPVPSATGQQAGTPDTANGPASRPVLPAPAAQGAVRAAAQQAASAPEPIAKHSSATPHPQRTIPPEKSAVSPQPAAPPPLPELNVTGIAWQRDGASRLAVVNGMYVSEGALIEGARVKLILPDRVLFYFNNEDVEVPMEKGPQ